MESGNHLGIYLRKNRATVVCLAPPGRERKVLGCFSVSVEGSEGQNQQLLADRIAQACHERKIKFVETAVALDCAAFMQHTVHSEFSDPKRIAATVRFDTEEALATDVSDVAVAFRVMSSGEDGSNLDVFTAQRGMLSEVLLSLQSNGIDPVTVDPDVCCLARYFLEYAKTQESSEQSTLHAALSDSRGYLVMVSGARQASALRTFLVGSTRNRSDLLVRETLVTTGLAEPGHPVACLSAFDAGGELVSDLLHEKTGLKVGLCDLAAMAGAKPDDIKDCPNAVDFAIACGAALMLMETASSTNLRNDHMPFLGKTRRLQKAVRFLSISLTVLLLAVGVFFHSQLLKVNKQRSDLLRKLEVDFRLVMLGEKEFPDTMKKGVDALDKLLRKVRAEKEGPGSNQETTSAKLTAVLLALNSCARQIDLNIGDIQVTDTYLTITGDTSSRTSSVNDLPEALKKAGLDAGTPSTVRTEGDRDKFTIRVEFKKR